MDINIVFNDFLISLLHESFRGISRKKNGHNMYVYLTLVFNALNNSYKWVRNMYWHNLWIFLFFS
jgi:hypothetical protein